MPCRRLPCIIMSVAGGGFMAHDISMHVNHNQTELGNIQQSLKSKHTFGEHAHAWAAHGRPTISLGASLGDSPTNSYKRTTIWLCMIPSSMPDGINSQTQHSSQIQHAPPPASFYGLQTLLQSRTGGYLAMVREPAI